MDQPPKSFIQFLSTGPSAPALLICFFSPIFTFPNLLTGWFTGFLSTSIKYTNKKSLSKMDIKVERADMT